MEQQICRIIAQSYALSFEDVWKIYEQVNSIDKILTMIETKELR